MSSVEGSSLKRSLLAGLMFGMVEATGFSLIGLIALVGRAVSFSEYLGIVAGYYLGFGLGGILAAALWKPLKSSAIGAAILGFVALGPVWAGAGISYSGLHDFLTTGPLILWAIASILSGCGLSLQAYTSHEWPFGTEDM